MALYVDDKVDEAVDMVLRVEEVSNAVENLDVPASSCDFLSLFPPCLSLLFSS